MGKSATKKKARSTKRRVRDLGVKAATQVKGGGKPRFDPLLKGEHIKEATIEV